MKLVVLQIFRKFFSEALKLTTLHCMLVNPVLALFITVFDNKNILYMAMVCLR